MLQNIKTNHQKIEPVKQLTTTQGVECKRNINSVQFMKTSSNWKNSQVHLGHSKYE